MNKEEICKCGHEREYHITGTHGCLFPEKAVIINFEKVDCKCKKFEAETHREWIERTSKENSEKHNS